MRDTNRGAVKAAAVVMLLLFSAFDPNGWLIFAPTKWLVATAGAAALTVFIRSWSLHRWSTRVWLLALGWGTFVSVVAVDPLYTWIGTPDRHLGLLAWVIFAIMFAAGQSIVAGSGVTWILRTGVVATLIVGLIAIFEWMGRPVVEVTGVSDRLGATFGSPAYLGAAVVLLLPLTVAVAVNRRMPSAWRWAGQLGAATGVAMAIGTQTRASWAGLAAAAVIAAPAASTWLRAHRAAALLAVAVVVAAIVSSPFADRLGDTFSSGFPSRVDEWAVAVDAIVSRPLTGSGFEGYRVVFEEAVPASYEQAYGRTVIPDRAHSGALDVAVTTGLVGLGFYVLAGIWLIKRSWASARLGDVERVALAAATVGYLIQQQFLFPLAELDPVFWLIAGALIAQESDRIEFHSPTWVQGAAGVLLVTSLWIGARDIAADRAVAEALDAADHVDASAAVAQATGHRPDSIRYWLAAAAIASAPGDAAAYHDALAFVDQAALRSPEDPAVLRSGADLTLALAITTGDPGDVEEARIIASELAQRDSHNTGNQIRRGVSLALAGQVLDAENAFLLAADLSPSSSEPYELLEQLARQTGDTVAADQWRALAADRSTNTNP